MNFRRACHKLRMYQRRHDQKNRKKGFIFAKNYEEYHKRQRQQLAAAIKQLTLEPQA